MRPRRDTFAVAYIDMVLDRFERTVKNGLLTEVMVAWVRDVLDAYFDATQTSKNEVIARARKPLPRTPARDRPPVRWPIGCG